MNFWHLMVWERDIKLHLDMADCLGGATKRSCSFLNHSLFFSPSWPVWIVPTKPRFHFCGSDLLLMKANSSAPADQNHRFLIQIWIGPQIVFKGLKLSSETTKTRPLLSALISALSSEFSQQLFKLWTLWVFQLKVLMSFSSHPPSMVRSIIVMSYNLGTNFYLRDSFLLWKKNTMTKANWGGKSLFQLIALRSHPTIQVRAGVCKEELRQMSWRNTIYTYWLDPMTWSACCPKRHCPQCVGFPISIINQENAPTGLPTGHLTEAFYV